jgi:caa(3)-type oxidase subunit IV
MSASAISRRAYGQAFAALTVLTAAEIGVVYVPGVAHVLLVSALVLLALAKAGLVLMVFMHLGRETRGLRRAVLAPFLLPAGYAFALVAEAAWRFWR